MSAIKDGLWYLGQMSPEQILEGHCTKASLVWQMGCLLYFLLTDTWPFHQATTLYGQVKRNVILQRYLHHHDEAVQAIFERVFVEQDRITLDELLSMVRALTEKPLLTKQSQGIP